jgi:hypothetical protein
VKKSIDHQLGSREHYVSALLGLAVFFANRGIPDPFIETNYITTGMMATIGNYSDRCPRELKRTRTA